MGEFLSGSHKRLGTGRSLRKSLRWRGNSGTGSIGAVRCDSLLARTRAPEPSAAPGPHGVTHHLRVLRGTVDLVQVVSQSSYPRAYAGGVPRRVGRRPSSS